MAIMGYTLLAPEMVILWAGRQHYAARSLVKKHGENRRWTQAHAFFLIMGGFTLHEGGKPVRVLVAKELEELSSAGKIEWPTITEEEIADRSKGDYLSKTIVLSQTAWFIAQCIARGVYGLAVTELEVVTLAFAILTGVIYYFWWDKPLDVRCSVPVQLLKDNLNADHRRNPSTPIQVGTATPNPPLTRMQQFQAFRKHACMQHGTLLGLGYVFIGFPLSRFWYGLGDMLVSRLPGKKALRVPTFYSPSDEIYDNGISFPLVICVAIIFGGIHCIAWSFHFATLRERWAWRISAILVSGLPTFLMVSMYLLSAINKIGGIDGMDDAYDSMWRCILMPVGFLYFISRIILLILPFVALRALLPGAYVQLDWVSFLPHI